MIERDWREGWNGLVRVMLLVGESFFGFFHDDKNSFRPRAPHYHCKRTHIALDGSNTREMQFLVNTWPVLVDGSRGRFPLSMSTTSGSHPVRESQERRGISNLRKHQARESDVSRRSVCHS